jgi:hypothetical protein
MSVSAWCLRSDSAVATTSSRQLGEPPVSGGMTGQPGGFGELGREPLNPPADGDVVHGDAPLGQKLLNIAVRQPVPQVPPDGNRDHLPREPEASKH